MKQSALSFSRLLKAGLVIAMLAMGLCAALIMSGCSSKEKITILTSAEDYFIEDLQSALDEKFPDYNINVEYMSTGNIAAKISNEGAKTDCDIIFDFEYAYLQKLAAEGNLENLDGLYDFSIYTKDAVESTYYYPVLRNGGAIVVNMALLKEKGLEVPKSYSDLLKSDYKGLISMPSPKSSGTGYMFLLALVNSMGEDKAFEYFGKLSENILQYTESGSGPINALIQKEVTIGLGMTGQAVTELAQNDDLAILYFKEGSPYSLYGSAVPVGHMEKTGVKEVFDFLYSEYGTHVCETFFPEKIYKNKDFTVKNYPTNIEYANMSNYTIANKEHLLERWTF